MKILFIIPDGVGIRNYLYSHILTHLIGESHEVIIWHALSDNALHEVESLHNIKLHSEKLPYYKESVTEKFLRETISYARLRYNINVTKNQTIMTNWAPSTRNLGLKLFYKSVQTAGSLISYDTILKLENRYQTSVQRSKYLADFQAFLKYHKPDAIFNTHQRSVSAIPAMIAANELGIKTVSAIYSWDNLPKARLATRTDSYLVWSNYMKDEMNLYYPEIAKEKVFVAGTPQFDFYRDKSLYWSKEVFCQKCGLDPKKKVICFSGDDTRTSPYDPEYLEDLAVAVSEMKKNNRPQILFRRSPADLSDRYDAVLQKYNSIIKVSDPLWNRDKNSDSGALLYPSFEDVKLLVNIALHCDVVYNVGSTMAHDFAMFDKPAMYINYDQPHAKEWSVETIYKFQHFRSMKGLDAVSWVNSKDEIADVLRKVLETPELCSLDRKKWLEIIIGQQRDISKNIVDFLTKV